MKRAGRWLFNFLAALSLVLTVSMLGLWIRSYWCQDVITYSTEAGPTDLKKYDIASLPGRVTFHTLHFRLASEARATYVRSRQAGAGASLERFVHRYSEKPKMYPLAGSEFWKTWFGFGTFVSPPANPNDSSYTRRAATFPHWFVALIMSLPALVWIMNEIVRKRRLRPGHCPVCGYDLRATPDRCPECGAIPAVKGAAT